MRVGFWKISLTLLSLTGLVPGGHVYAESTWDKLSLKGLVNTLIQGVGEVLVPLATTILFFVFVYGIVIYVRATNSGDGKMVDLAKTRLLYGIIVLFAVFSLWGFIQILRNVFTG